MRLSRRNRMNTLKRTIKGREDRKFPGNLKPLSRIREIFIVIARSGYYG